MATVNDAMGYPQGHGGGGYYLSYAQQLGTSRKVDAPDSYPQFEAPCDFLAIGEEDRRRKSSTCSVCFDGIFEDFDNASSANLRKKSICDRQHAPSIDTPPDDSETSVHVGGFIPSAMPMSCHPAANKMQEYPMDPLFFDNPFIGADMSAAIPQSARQTTSQLSSSAASIAANADIQYKQELNQDARQDINGALHVCQARLERLEKLNAALEQFSTESWSTSDSRCLLEQRLHQNKYWPAIQRIFFAMRLKALQSSPGILPPFQPPSSADLGLSCRARHCGPEVAHELTSLRMVERQSVSTAESILRSLSADVPLCHEEAAAVLARVKAVYDPAKVALRGKVDRALQSRYPAATTTAAAQPLAAPAPAPQQKKNQIPEEARRVLEDWVMQNVDNPYPEKPQLKALVQMTGLSLRCVNNWLSNYRVRIWRPAVTTLHET